MARYKSDNDYSGTIGNLVFYKLNGKPVVRSRRRKMTKAEKKNLNPAIRLQNNRMITVSKFCKMLRSGIPEKYSCDSQRHELLVKHAFEILRNDSISSRDAFKMRKENLHHLNGVVLNNAIAPQILDKLNTTKFERHGENIEVHIPKLPLSKLAERPEEFKIWVQIKILSLQESYNINYVRLKESDWIEIDENEKMSFSFDVPKVGENEGLFGAIGFQSRTGGKLFNDVRLNGFVVRSLQPLT